VQIQADKIASLAEQMRNLFNGAAPAISRLLGLACLAFTVLLFFCPLRLVLLVAGTWRFVKRGLKYYQPFGLFRRGAKVSFNEMKELLSRVPSDVQRLRVSHVEASGNGSH
jgi:hypothetical protein